MIAYLSKIIREMESALVPDNTQNWQKADSAAKRIIRMKTDALNEFVNLFFHEFEGLNNIKY